MNTNYQKKYRMIDVSDKTSTQRTATASGKILVGKSAWEMIRNKTLPKGDPLSLSETAGILAAKNAPATIPLCHPLPLDKVTVETKLNAEDFSITVACVAKAFAKTGVEMEALAGVNGALLAIYDLTKQIEPALKITDIMLEEKIGGKSGHWIHPDLSKNNGFEKLNRLPFGGLRFSLITMSDRASKGEYQDISGTILKKSIESRGGKVTNKHVLEDSKNQLEQHLIKTLELKPDVIISTGGTGCGPRDITPEVFESFFTTKIDGIGECLRSSGAEHTPFSYLSRSVGGLCQKTLLIALPGSPKAMEQSINALENLIPHISKTAAGANHE